MSFIDIPVQVLSEEQEKSMSRVKYAEIAEIERQTKEFYLKGGKIQQVDIIKREAVPGLYNQPINGVYTGVCEMPDGWFRVTYRGNLIGKGYYKTKKAADGCLTRMQFKDGKLS